MVGGIPDVADTDGIDERARLEAIVYGRPTTTTTTTEAERAAAATALRALIAPTMASPTALGSADRLVVSLPHDAAAREVEAASWLPVARIPETGRFVRTVTGVLAGIALLAAVSGSPTPAPFADSMRVFDRPQTSGDATAAAEHGNLPGAGPELDVSTVRLVAEPAEGVVVLAYRTVDADVCLAIMVGGGGGGSCANEADFRTGGLHGGTLFPPSGWRYAWGPFGDPVISGPDD